ncbi:hypothetical protein ACQPZJ_14355 [Actinoplanes sp. CA-054009]
MRKARILLVALLALIGLLAGTVSAAHAAPTAGSGTAMSFQAAGGSGLKLLSMKASGTATAALAAPTICYVDSPYGPQLSPGGLEIEVGFTIQCQDPSTGFPATDVAACRPIGEVRYADLRPYGPQGIGGGFGVGPFCQTRAIANPLPPQPSTFRGFVTAIVVIQGIQYTGYFTTVRTLSLT